MRYAQATPTPLPLPYLPLHSLRSLWLNHTEYHRKLYHINYRRFLIISSNFLPSGSSRKTRSPDFKPSRISILLPIVEPVVTG